MDLTLLINTAHENNEIKSSTNISASTVLYYYYMFFDLGSNSNNPNTTLWAEETHHVSYKSLLSNA